MYLSGMKLGGIRDECGVSRQRIDQMVRVAKQQLAHRVFFACPPAGTNVAIKSRRRKGENTVLNKLKYVLLQEGLHTIRDQPKALNLSHSTTHHLFSGDRKFGVQCRTISRILKSRHLPKQARRLLKGFALPHAEEPLGPCRA
jgi:hypothetical protein